MIGADPGRGPITNRLPRRDVANINKVNVAQISLLGEMMAPGAAANRLGSNSIPHPAAEKRLAAPRRSATPAVFPAATKLTVTSAKLPAHPRRTSPDAQFRPWLPPPRPAAGALHRHARTEN